MKAAKTSSSSYKKDDDWANDDDTSVEKEEKVAIEAETDKPKPMAETGEQKFTRERQSEEGQPGKVADDRSGVPGEGLPFGGAQPALNETKTSNPPPPPKVKTAEEQAIEDEETDAVGKKTAESVEVDAIGKKSAAILQVNSATNANLARNDPLQGEPLHKAG